MAAWLRHKGKLLKIKIIPINGIRVQLHRRRMVLLNNPDNILRMVVRVSRDSILPRILLRMVARSRVGSILRRMDPVLRSSSTRHRTGNRNGGRMLLKEGATLWLFRVAR